MRGRSARSGSHTLAEAMDALELEARAFANTERRDRDARAAARLRARGTRRPARRDRGARGARGRRRARRRGGRGLHRPVAAPARRTAAGRGRVCRFTARPRLSGVTDLPAIEAIGLVKRYGAQRALDGVDLDVPRGAVLRDARPERRRQDHRGPHPRPRSYARRGLGAGSPDSTSRRDPVPCAGASGSPAQYAAVDDPLTGRENLEMIGELHRLGRGAPARERAASAARAVRRSPTPPTAREGRTRAACAGASTSRRASSPGPRCCSSTSRRPASTREPERPVGVLATLVGEGTTVLLTTQYLEEADQLADEIVVIDHGRVIARGHARRAQAPDRGRRLDVVGRRPRRRSRP